MKILLAEDDPNISTIAKMTLEAIGKHVVTVVNNGQQALETALAEQFDVILLDEMMPKMNGLKVCEEYKSQVLNPSPIIFLSAKTQSDVIEEFNRRGLGFIPKPFDPAKLCLMIEELLQKNGAA